MANEIKLPEGATPLSPPVKKTIGGWAEMEYDAQLDYRGITWYRVFNGMGGRGDREDWVADGVSICIAIHDYHWNGDSFGATYGSMSAAMDGELTRGLRRASDELISTRKEVESLENTVVCLETALKESK